MTIIFKAFKAVTKQFLITYTKVLAFLLAITSFFILFGAFALMGEIEQSDLIIPDGTTLNYLAGNKYSKNYLAVVPISGVILTEPSNDPLSSWLESQITYGYEVKDLLLNMAEMDSIKGVILHIDSPGGTVVGSKAIGDGINAYRQRTSKPIFAYVSGTSASGSYWAASQADKIIADTGTNIGSIGVIFGPFKYYKGVIEEDYGAFSGGVVTQDGVETTYITGGKSKDVGNPYRQITAEEKAILQEGVNDAYTEFVKAVAQGRKISEFTIVEQIGAMIYGEKQAGELGLIDAVGSRHSAFQDLVNTVGISGDDYQFVQPNSALGFWQELSAQGFALFDKKDSVRGCPLAGSLLSFYGDVNTLCRF